MTPDKIRFGKACLIVNPDHFLETETGRVWTPERNKRAWEICFQTLEEVLGRKAEPPRVVVVCGLQAAGKSTWIERQDSPDGDVVYVDAALPGVRHRQPILAIAWHYRATADAVGIDTGLDVALQRNALRSPRAADSYLESLRDTYLFVLAPLFLFEASPQQRTLL